MKKISKVQVAQYLEQKEKRKEPTERWEICFHCAECDRYIPHEEWQLHKDSELMKRAVEGLGLSSPVKPDDEDFRESDRKLGDAEAYRYAQARRIARAAIQYWTAKGEHLDLVARLKAGDLVPKGGKHGLH